MDVKDFLTIRGLHLKLPEATVEPVTPTPSLGSFVRKSPAQPFVERAGGRLGPWDGGQGGGRGGGRQLKTTPSTSQFFEAGPSQGLYGGSGGLALTPRAPVKHEGAGQTTGYLRVKQPRKEQSPVCRGWWPWRLKLCQVTGLTEDQPKEPEALLPQSLLCPRP